MCEGCFAKSLPPGEREKYLENYYRRYRSLTKEDLNKMESLFRNQMPVLEVNYGKRNLICVCGNWKHGIHDVCYACLQKQGDK